MGCIWNTYNTSVNSRGNELMLLDVTLPAPKRILLNTQPKPHFTVTSQAQQL